MSAQTICTLTGSARVDDLPTSSGYVRERCRSWTPRRSHAVRDRDLAALCLPRRHHAVGPDPPQHDFTTRTCRPEYELRACRLSCLAPCNYIYRGCYLPMGRSVTPSLPLFHQHHASLNNYGPPGVHCDDRPEARGSASRGRSRAGASNRDGSQGARERGRRRGASSRRVSHSVGQGKSGIEASQSGTRSHRGGTQVASPQNGFHPCTAHGWVSAGIYSILGI